jgi:hypothetical protein
MNFVFIWILVWRSVQGCDEIAMKEYLEEQLKEYYCLIRMNETQYSNAET